MKYLPNYYVAVINTSVEIKFPNPRDLCNKLKITRSTKFTEKPEVQLER